MDNGGCQHICQNIPGSYYCECRDGYTLLKDGFKCQGNWTFIIMALYMHNYIAQPCPTLFEPVNGLMVCSGPQVTDEHCAFTCDQGYELEGSSNRSCLANNTWSGVDSSCPPLLCGELQHSNNTAIGQPCFDEFNSTCTVICEEGFQVDNNSTLFDQTCSLINETNTVKWTEPKTCSGMFIQGIRGGVHIVTTNRITLLTTCI